mgnify:FL=1
MRECRAVITSITDERLLENINILRLLRELPYIVSIVICCRCGIVVEVLTIYMTLPHSLAQSKVNLLKTLRLTESNNVMLDFHLFAATIHDFLSRTNVNV